MGDGYRAVVYIINAAVNTNENDDGSSQYFMDSVRRTRNPAVFHRCFDHTCRVQNPEPIESWGRRPQER